MGMDVHSISTAPYVAPAPSPRAAASSCDDPSWRNQSSGLETSKPLPRLHNLDGKLQIKHWLTKLQIRFFPPFPVRVKYHLQVLCSEFFQSLLPSYFVICLVCLGVSPCFLPRIDHMLPASVIACGSGGRLKIPF